MEGGQSCRKNVTQKPPHHNNTSLRSPKLKRRPPLNFLFDLSRVLSHGEARSKRYGRGAAGTCASNTSVGRAARFRVRESVPVTGKDHFLLVFFLPRTDRESKVGFLMVAHQIEQHSIVGANDASSSSCCLSILYHVPPHTHTQPHTPPFDPSSTVKPRLVSRHRKCALVPACGW